MRARRQGTDGPGVTTFVRGCNGMSGIYRQPTGLRPTLAAIDAGVTPVDRAIRTA